MLSNPYTPPSSEAKILDPQLNAPGTILSLIGLSLFTFPIAGRPIATYFLNRALSSFEQNHSTYEVFESEMRFSMTIFLFTLAIGLIGAICILTSFFSKKHRTPWFFYTTIIISILWSITIFPFGLIIGLPIIITFLIKRKEFLTNNQLKPTNPTPNT